MSATFGRPPLWRRVRPYLTGFDAPLAAALLWLVAIGCIVLFSALQDAHVPFDDHLRNLASVFWCCSSRRRCRRSG
jgi:hypothetical protein